MLKIKKKNEIVRVFWRLGLNTFSTCEVLSPCLSGPSLFLCHFFIEMKFSLH